MKIINEERISLSGTVSIIVALYNSERYLDQLLQSIASQTYQDIEVILVDDGSPDNCGAICDDFARGDSRFHVIHKNNGGVSDARNRGLDQATGEWVTFVDGDDWLEPDYVEYMLRVAILTNSEMAFSTELLTSGDKKQTIRDRIELWTSEEAAAFILYMKMVLGPWNKIYKKSLIDDNHIRFDIPWFGEGLYFSTKCAQLANHVGVGHRKVYGYRTDNSYSGTNMYDIDHGLNARSNIAFIKDALIIRTKPILDAVEWHQWNSYFFLLIQIIGSGSTEAYKSDYRDCIAQLKRGWPKVFVNSDVSVKGKLKILLKGVFPVAMAKLSIAKKMLGLQLR